MPRGLPQICKCGRKHWSTTSDQCPLCRRVPSSRRRASLPFFRILDHDVPASPSLVRASDAGHCLGSHTSTSEDVRRCRIHWRHLSHRHCPTVGCGRAMSTRAALCGGCSALELFEPQARALREIMHPEPWVDPFPGIDHYSERGYDEYHADLLGLPVTVAL